MDCYDLNKLITTQNVFNYKTEGTKDENNVRHKVVKFEWNFNKDAQSITTTTHSYS